MQNNGFSMADALRLAQSPAGQQLLRLLQEQSDGKLQQAMEQAAAGNYEPAKKILSSLKNNPQARALLEQLGGSHG